MKRIRSRLIFAVIAVLCVASVIVGATDPVMASSPPSAGRATTAQTTAYYQAGGQTTAGRPKTAWMDNLRLPNIATEGETPANRFPVDYHEDSSTVVQFYRNANWGLVEYNWQPTELSHRPTYFEDVMVERHGHTALKPLQPLFSGARFVSNAAMLPYNMTIQPPHHHFSTLGHYRVGSWAPSLTQRAPWQWDAAEVQAGATAGLILLIP